MSEELLTLNVEAIRDFQVCELYYRYKYVDKQHIPIYSRELMVDKFENTLSKVASFFFYKKQADNVPSYNAILNRWEKLWFPKDMTAYDMAVEQHEASRGNMASYSNVATASLERFYDEFIDDPADPIMIDESFLVPLKRDMRLQGSIDLVLRDKDKYRVIKWVGKSRRSDSLMLDMAALRFAFEYRNESPKQVTYECYDLTSAKSVFLDIDQPTKADVNALLYWAQEIAEKDIYVPRRGFTAYCRGCPFDKPCSQFENWPEAIQ